jgi:predicted nucleotidyltransferase
VTSAEIIEEIQTRIARAAPPDSQVILFGPRARDDGDDGSDYDILVIEPVVQDAAVEGFGSEVSFRTRWRRRSVRAAQAGADRRP